MLGRASFDMSVGGGGAWSCGAPGCMIPDGMGVLVPDEGVRWGVASWCASVLLTLDADMPAEALVWLLSRRRLVPSLTLGCK